jgi:uncharacterized membrane protein
MSELIALGFDSEAAAAAFGRRLAELQETSVLQLEDAAEVQVSSAGRSSIRHATDLVGPGALGGVFWGAFFALVFFVPAIGPIIAAGMALIHEKLGDLGLERRFISELGETIRPGQAGWVLLMRVADEGQFLAAAEGTHARLVRTNLPPREQAQLREAFGS